jgi:hypothetical protein
VVLARGCEYLWVGTTRNQAVGIDRVPGGDERIYFIGVGEERADGIGIARHVEERFWLLRARGERCADYKDEKASQNFHGIRMLCGSLLGDNVARSQSSQRLLPPPPALAERSYCVCVGRSVLSPITKFRDLWSIGSRIRCPSTARQRRGRPVRGPIRGFCPGMATSEYQYSGKCVYQELGD